jgi:hypothetical protein
LVKDVESRAEAGCVFLRNREDSDTALCAAGTADKVMSAAGGGVGESRIDDLDQVCHFLGHFGVK